MSVNWKIDTTHSEIQFKVKHLMITTVTGNFTKFDGEAVTEGQDFNTVASIGFNAEVNSITTNNEQRDGHLKSPEFFDAAQFPEISFKSTRFSVLKNNATLDGELTIKGITKAVALDVDFGGIVVDPYGQTKAGFTISGKIKRKEFGLVWNAVTEAGSVVLSDDVTIQAEVQLIKQA